jgi:biofilm PGA synthesis N-glycosyltransferase PgaC
MVNFIDGVFLFYMFVGLYMLSLFIILHYTNRQTIFDTPKGKVDNVSIVMPCFNEEEHIGEGIEGLLDLDWPKDNLEIIIVDDASKDGSVEVIEKYVKKYPSLVRLIKHSKNSGCAAGPKNTGTLAAKYNYVVTADGDSKPDRDALRKMIGYMQDDGNVAAVTCAVMAKTPKTFIQKVQSIEYAIIAWNRKLLDLVDAVYVTPGPFALYKKDILKKVGMFDMKNMTEDIEIVWRLRSKGYSAKMALGTRVHSQTPTRFKQWFKQRIRWNIGGTQSLIKYKSFVFKKGMLGAFIIPFFTASLMLGLLGLAIFFYLLVRRLLTGYLTTKYSIAGGTGIFYLQDLTFSPSILNFLGAALFIAGGLFTLTGLGIMDKPKLVKGNFLSILFYMVIYLSIYPIIMIVSLTKLATGRYSW